MRLFSLSFALLAIALSTTRAQDDSLLKNLSSDQVATLKQGQMVVASENVPGGPWPRLKVYTLVNASVPVIKSVFLDYANAQNYIPNLVSAKVVDRPSANVVDVAYTSHMPIVGNSTSTVRNTYVTKGNALTVDWNLLSSTVADVSTGQLKVEPFGSGSLMRYTNYVVPKSSLAFLAKGVAMNEVKATVAAIKKQAEKVAAQGGSN